MDRSVLHGKNPCLYNYTCIGKRVNKNDASNSRENKTQDNDRENGWGKNKKQIYCSNNMLLGRKKKEIIMLLLVLFMFIFKSKNLLIE